METGQVRAEKNWNFCALCEQETEEKLTCPLKSARKNYGSGYKSLADDLQQFREIGELPIQASLSSLDEGNGIEETLKCHEAKWHKPCFRLQNSRFRLFRKARSAISVILECRASLSVILECRASEKTTVGFSYNEFVLSRCRIMSREVTEIA